MAQEASGERRETANWPKAAEGIQLAGFAVFLLLNTTGLLPWSFWLDAIALWPLLIMSAGIRIAFERSGAPWLVLLGPAVVVGGLCWVATGRPRTEAEPGVWTAQSAARAEGTHRLTVEARVGGAQLDLQSRALEKGLVADGRAAGRHDRSRLDVGMDGDEARLKLVGGRRDGLVFLPGRRERWDLGLAADLPVRLDVDGVGVRGRLDLAGGRVADGAIRGVFMAFDLRLPKPEQTVTLRLNGVFNALRVSVPDGTPVHVQGAGLPFNAVDRETLGEKGAPGYEIKLEGIFTAVTVDARPAAPPVETPAPPAEAPAEKPRPSPEAEAPPSGRVS